MSPHSSVRKAVLASALSISLAGCAGPGSFGPFFSSDSGTLTRKQTNVFVIQNPTSFGSGQGSILQFPADSSGSVMPTATINGPANTSFHGLATDGSGDVYASYYGPTNPGGVVGYSAGSTGDATPMRSLTADATTGLTAVDGLAASAAGEIFAGEDYGSVQVFSARAMGSVAPARHILGAYETGGGLSTIGSAYAVAADRADELFVVNQGYYGGQPLLVFGPTADGNVAPIYSIGGNLTGMTVGSANGVALDSSGNVYVTTNSASGSWPTVVYNGSILEFAAGAQGNVAPIRTISGPSTQLQALSGIAVDSAGNIYVVSATVPSSPAAPTLLKFSPGASGDVAPASTFTSPAWTNPDNSRSIAVF